MGFALLIILLIAFSVYECNGAYGRGQCFQYIL